MKGKLVGHQVDSLVTVQYGSEEDKIAGIAEFKNKGFHVLEPFVKDGVYTVSYTKKEFRSVNRDSAIAGEPLFWSLNGSFATMKGLLKIIDERKIKTLDELFKYGNAHLDMLRKDMAKHSHLPGKVTNKEDEK